MLSDPIQQTQFIKFIFTVRNMPQSGKIQRHAVLSSGLKSHSCQFAVVIKTQTQVDAFAQIRSIFLNYVYCDFHFFIPRKSRTCSVFFFGA